MLALLAANGIRQPLHAPTLAGLLDAAAALEAVGAERVSGCYALTGRARELEALLCDRGLGIVLRRASGGPDYEGEDLECLSVRVVG